MKPNKPLTEAQRAALLKRIDGLVVDLMGSPFVVKVIEMYPSLGECSSRKQEIYISPDNRDPLSTLWHECRHATEAMFGLDAEDTTVTNEMRVRYDEITTRCLLRYNPIFCEM